MQKKNSPVHLLLLDPSQNDAEKVVSLLRNEGHATRAHRLTSLEDFEESLNNQSWDLFIARETDGESGYLEYLKQINTLENDIPTIVLTDSFTEDKAIAAMKAGVRDILPTDAKVRLTLVVKRELGDLEARRNSRLTESQMREAEKRCNILLESSMDAIAYINEGMHVYGNQAYLALFGYEDIDELMCIPVMDVIAASSTADFKAFLKKQSTNLAKTDGATHELNCRVKKSDEGELDVSIGFSQASYDGEACIQLIMRSQVDHELEERLRKFASEDLLTGLYNREHFNGRLDSFVEKAIKDKNIGCLLYIQLDNFDDTRNEYGIAAADSILGDVAGLLKKVCKDDYVLARLGDETFGVLTPKLDATMGEQLAGKICKNIDEQLFEAGGKTVQITSSVGLTRVNENSPTTPELISRGHKACSHISEKQAIKGIKGNAYYLYNSMDFEEGTAQTEDMMLMLQQSLDNNRFRILFQPIIGLRGEVEEHYEASIRMLDDNNEEIAPNKFLPFASSSELALKLDRWVILQNIKSLSAHRSKGHNSRLFINITQFTITSKNFVDWLGIALRAARLPAASLILQMNEEQAVQYLMQAKTFSEGIRKLGCGIAITRFGCALNPFNTLKHVEADYIKFDGSFTEEIQKNDAAKKSLKEMVAQLQKMNKLTIVPFVENASVLSTLWQAGVNYIQGYYLQGPSEAMNYDFSED